MFNLGSTFNFAALSQANYQLAQNTAVNSPGVVQSINQNAANGATVIQLGRN
jgi:hypothetical protein